jgi:hypothetical protein
MNLFSQHKTASPNVDRKASGVAAIFGLRPSHAVQAEPATVRLSLLGREHAGKTALLNLVSQGTDGLASGLQVDVEGPWDMAKRIQDTRQTVELLRRTGLPSTLDRPKLEVHLYEGDVKWITLSFHEVVGQLLSSTTRESSPEQKEQCGAYLSELMLSDVAWVVLPSPPREATYDDLSRYDNDIKLTRAYLRESLRLRSGHPCSVAIVLTKLDTLFTGAEEAKAQLEKGHLIEVLRPLCDILQASEKVNRAAIFPTTSFGWNNAIPRQVKQDANGKSDGIPHDGRQAGGLEQGETEWILRPGVSPQPYNLTALLVWTFVSGILFQHFCDDHHTEGGLGRICSSLNGDLKALENAWYVHLKGEELSME